MSVMKKILVFVFISSCCFSCKQNTSLKDSSPDALLNIDALTASPANFKRLLENDTVRVLEYTLKPGEKDQWHTHPPKSSYVVTGGKVKVYLENGDTIIADEKAGDVSWRNYVGKHYVENIGTTEVKVILTEVKSAAKQ